MEGAELFETGFANATRYLYKKFYANTSFERGTKGISSGLV